MRRIPLSLFLCVLLVPLVTSARALANDDKPFELLDSDRVVLIGNTFIEREQTYSYLETFLRTRWPERNITFRNLGWSGDDVAGQARGYEKGAAAGFAQLDAIVHELKPTVIVISYGMGESFEGEAGLGAFRDGLGKMLEMLKDLNARTVLIGPIRHENLGPPLPDPAEHNRKLQLYIAAMSDIARERGHRFIDLFALLGDGTLAHPPAPFTENGIHLTPYGYWRASGVIERALGLPERGWDIVIDGSIDGTKVVRAGGTQSCEVTHDQRVWTLRVTPLVLPTPPPPTDAPASAARGVANQPGSPASKRTITFTDLPQGEYLLSADGKPVASGSSEAWAKGIELLDDPVSRVVEKVRDLSIQKNVQYFNQWRPANEPYIFGFRKQEQSRNRVEIPRFAEPIERFEAEISKLSRPTDVIYELKPQ